MEGRRCGQAGRLRRSLEGPQLAISAWEGNWDVPIDPPTHPGMRVPDASPHLPSGAIVGNCSPGPKADSRVPILGWGQEGFPKVFGLLLPLGNTDRKGTVLELCSKSQAGEQKALPTDCQEAVAADETRTLGSSSSPWPHLTAPCPSRAWTQADPGPSVQASTSI